ncbi:hypothetical protein V1515DRAFT_261748 [Lipomyces mesembrius]
MKELNLTSVTALRLCTGVFARTMGNWRCKYRTTEYRESGGTSVTVSHLMQHNINISSAQELMQANISDAFKNAQKLLITYVAASLCRY